MAGREALVPLRAELRQRRALEHGTVMGTADELRARTPACGSQVQTEGVPALTFAQLGPASDDSVSSAPSAAWPGAARDQRPPLSSYFPWRRPVLSSVWIDASLIRRSMSVPARARISGGVRPGCSRRACSTNRGTEPLGARLRPLVRRPGAAAVLAFRPRGALGCGAPPARRTTSSSFLVSRF